MTVLVRSRNFNVESFKFRRNGRKIEFYRIVIRKSVTILPILDDGRIVIEKQYRPAVRRNIYELPAGHGEKGEDPKQSAIRELEEETGYLAGDLRLLFVAYLAPGSSTELMYFYVARKLKKTKANREQDEFISQSAISFGKALRMIKDNTITDTKTIACLLYYKEFAQKG